MNYKEFAQEYLRKIGAYDVDGNYDGMLGGAIMALVEAHSAQGHSGMSSSIALQAFYDLNQAYSGEGKYKDKMHQIWQDFWDSPEGQKIQLGVSTPTTTDEKGGE